MEKYYLAIIATAVSAALTPIIRRIAFKINVIDVPKDERRIHKKPIPLLGGLAIYFAFVITLLLKKDNLSLSEIGTIFGATIIVIGGFLDDKYEIKPKYKIMFQLTSAIVLILFGVEIKQLTNPLSIGGSYVDIGWLSIPLTIIWIVGITNALNLIDGLDGLAAGVALISSITIFIVAVMNDRPDSAILIAILAGSILGFLPYNFNPASIFMGDTGAQLLGFLLAAISIKGAVKSTAAFAIVVPILALGIPIYDTLFAMIRRKINGKSIMQADKGHLHHRLLSMGLNQKQVVIIMYMVSAVLGGFAILAAMQISTQKSYLMLVSVMLVLIILAWKLKFFQHRE